MKKVFIFLSFSIFLSSCSKDKNGKTSFAVAPESLVAYMKSKIIEEPDATVSIFANKLSGSSQALPLIQISGSLNAKLGNGSIIKQISVADINLPRLFDSTGNKYFFQTSYNGDKGFGQKNKVDFLTDLFDLKTDFQLPELITLKTENSMISKSKGFHLYWNKDESNTLPVQITLNFDEISSTYLDPNFPKMNGIVQFSKFVEDSGEYTISPSELSSFPSKGIAIISITRGNFMYQKISDKNMLIYSLATDTNSSLHLSE